MVARHRDDYSRLASPFPFRTEGNGDENSKKVLNANAQDLFFERLSQKSTHNVLYNAGALFKYA
jgi:hypothetical protein